jgi:hypothetical protein
MSDHIPDATKMVPDGYYTALVQCDTGGEIFQAVEVCEGKIFRSSGLELNASACSDFIPLAACNFCSAFPVIAGAELETLRTANAALVGEVERLQAWKDSWLDIESKWNAVAIAVMLGGKNGESTRAVIAREVPKLVERVKRLEEAGDRMADELRRDCTGMGRAVILDNWAKAKATP